MTKRTILLLVLGALIGACTPAVQQPPSVTPEGEDRYLIDPRIGYVQLDPVTDRAFDAAWRFALAGNEAEARRRLEEIRRKTPDFAPGLLLEAAIDIRAGRLDAAASAVEQALARVGSYTAARVYEAEIAYLRNDTRRAYELYRALAAQADAPATASERASALRVTLFNELYTSARTAPDADAIRLLREALTFDPAAIEPRILLARKLLGQRNFDDARRELDPLINTAEVDRNEVQEMLAEIDIGRGRYQEAIVRYDRLSRRTKDPRYTERLEQVKEEWSMANMPAHYRAALESAAISRADLAVLLYWTVPSIRFARNLGSPPIAVDIEDVAGREEIIRAIAVGMYEIDPVTRRVSPFRQVTAERLSRLLTRLVQLRGACARGVAPDKVLATCGVTDPLATWPADAPVAGRDAERLLEQVAKALQ